jgi:hypothetical protein
MIDANTATYDANGNKGEKNVGGGNPRVCIGVNGGWPTLAASPKGLPHPLVLCEGGCDAARSVVSQCRKNVGRVIH